ncbi:MAG: hypothetical protein ACR2H9_16070 [Longimicrobiaceae bacterium]
MTQAEILQTIQVLPGWHITHGSPRLMEARGPYGLTLVAEMAGFGYWTVHVGAERAETLVRSMDDLAAWLERVEQEGMCPPTE